MLKQKLIHTSLYLAILCSIFWAIPVHAETNQGASYAVAPQLTATQVNPQVSYFDIKVIPGKAQTISSVISNSGSQPIYVRQQFNNAYTSTNGGIAYVTGNKAPQADPSLQYPLNKLVTIKGPAVVMIPAHSSKTVTARVHAKIDQNFNGIILGGWYFENVDQHGKALVSNQPGINFTYSYLTGVELEVGHAVKPRLALDKVTYHKNINTGDPNLAVKLLNSQAAILRNAKLNVTITKDKKEFAKHTYTGITLAPNSNVAYELTGLKALTPGKYTVTIDGINGQQKVTTQQVVTLAKQTQTKDLHATVKPTSTINQPRYLGWKIAVGVLAIIIVMLFWILKKRL